MVYLLLGSNVGNRDYYLDQTVQILSGHMKVTATSKIYETEAWGDRSQSPYLNMAIQATVDCSPVELHEITKKVEQKLGRTDKGKYKPRTIDIDLLFFGNEKVDTTDLIIPHPRIQMRRFVLIPLCEIDPTIMHPVFQIDVKDLLDECEDQLKVYPYQRAENHLN